MMNPRVRIYNGMDEDSTLVGFSLNASDAVVGEGFAQFMAERGYAWEVVRDELADSLSATHVEVRPPMTAEDIQELGTLCVGGEINGQYYPPIVDPNNSGTLVFDNRVLSASQSGGGGQLIAES